MERGWQSRMFFCQPGFLPGYVFVTLTLSLSLLRCAGKARENSFALAALFAAGERST
jgi:hypothetical protein